MQNYTTYIALQKKKRTRVLEAPGIPTFTPASLDAAIGLSVVRGGGGRPSSYDYQLRRRNTDNTAWEAEQTPVNFTAPSLNITVFSSGVGIENSRRYEVRVRAKNDTGTSNWSSWEEVIPLETLNPPTYTMTLGVNIIDIAITAPTSGATPVNFQYQMWVADADGVFRPGDGSENQSRLLEVLVSTTSLALGQYLGHVANEDFINGRKYRLRMRSRDVSRPGTDRDAGPWGEWVEITFRSLNVPTFTLVARGGASPIITITLTKVENATSYELEVDKRNDDDDAWLAQYGDEFRVSWRDDGSTLTYHLYDWIASSTRRETLITGRKYRIRIRAVNAIGSTDYSDYQEVTIPS